MCSILFSFRLLKQQVHALGTLKEIHPQYTQDLSWETLVGKKTQQSFINIDSSTSTMSLSREISPNIR